MPSPRKMRARFGPAYRARHSYWLTVKHDGWTDRLYVCPVIEPVQWISLGPGTPMAEGL
jgi:hypothetical protein